MASRELERFARDMFSDDGLYRAALMAGDRCRSVAELETFLLTLGYDVRAADLRDAQGCRAPVLGPG